MCGRYIIDSEDTENIEILRILNDINKKYPSQEFKTGEIFPTNSVPILLSENNDITPDLFIWGFPHFKNKGVIINARAETVQEKKFFNDSFNLRRCIIPSTGFFEWKQDETKQKYLFNLPNQKNLYMAGLYNEFKGEKRFVVLTTSANNSMIDIHNRMPIILEKDMIYSWIFDTSKAKEILNDTPPLLKSEVV